MIEITITITVWLVLSDDQFIYALKFIPWLLS